MNLTALKACTAALVSATVCHNIQRHVTITTAHNCIATSADVVEPHSMSLEQRPRLVTLTEVA